MNKLLAKRYKSEKRFRLLGAFSVFVGIAFLATLLFTIFSTGYTAFLSTKIALELDLTGLTSNELNKSSIRKISKQAIAILLQEEPSKLMKRKMEKNIFSKQSIKEIESYLKHNSEELKSKQQVWVTTSSTLDQLHKGNLDLKNSALSDSLGEPLQKLYEKLVSEGKIKRKINLSFLTHGDSRAPELAGLGGALLGSFYTLLVCFLLSFPIAVSAAIYLEEFAPKNKFTSFIEININNLAAVPSIIFGLLGLVVVLGFFGVPRSTPLAGGIVLALRTLPIIVIACRAAIRAVPSSIRQAAMAIGASEMQVVLHHVLPLSLPGTLTGAIIGLSQALGETAPLLLIGMVAFIVDLPATPLDASSTLPVQIYLWAESSERGFVEKTSAAIMVILTFLIAMNSLAVMLRNRYEKRW